MPLSHDHQAILVHIPRNAGTAISEALDMEDDGHFTWWDYKRRYPGEWRRYLTFTVVRNPFDRAVSAYCYSKTKQSYWHSDNGSTKYGIHPDYDKLKNKSFKQALKICAIGGLEGQHWQEQVPFFANKQGIIQINETLKFENLEEDFGKLCDKLDCDVKLDKINPSNRRKDYRSYYDEDIKSLVWRIYERDIYYLDYQF